MSTFFESGTDKAVKGEGWALPYMGCAQDTVNLELHCPYGYGKPSPLPNTCMLCNLLVPLPLPSMMCNLLVLNQPPQPKVLNCLQTNLAPRP